MSLLSNADIEQAMARKDIVIKPFDRASLTPVGYDVRVGPWVADLTKGAEKLLPTAFLNGDPFKPGFWILPHHVVLILTEESIRVSRHIGGTLHTMVSPVARGLSSISTTLDPGWIGKFFVTVTNLTEAPVFLEKGEPFTTLIFYKVATPAVGTTPNAPRKLREIVKRLTREAGMSEALTSAIVEAHATVEAETQAEAVDQGIRQDVIVIERRRSLRILAVRLIGLFVIAVALAWLVALTIADPPDQTSFFQTIASIVATVAVVLVAWQGRDR